MEELRLPYGDALDRARVSPWRDARGQAQVVGRWMGFTGSPGDLASQGRGLGRFTYPEGKPLDRVETQTLPISAPCWMPGMAARVIFAAGDGFLYRFDFEDELARDLPADSREPIRLRWEVEDREESSLILSEPYWPDLPGLRDTLFVGCQVREEGTSQGEPGFRHAGIWWLRLDPEGAAIIAAGPVGFQPSSDPLRFPTVAATADGSPFLSVLVQTSGAAEARLAVAPLELDPVRGVPRVAAEARVVAGGCRLSPPVVSEDGRAITCVVGSRVRVVWLGDAGEALLAQRPKRNTALTPGS
jgi:hypothetical protein